MCKNSFMLTVSQQKSRFGKMYYISAAKTAFNHIHHWTAGSLAVCNATFFNLAWQTPDWKDRVILRMFPQLMDLFYFIFIFWSGDGVKGVASSNLTALSQHFCSYFSFDNLIFGGKCVIFLPQQPQQCQVFLWVIKISSCWSYHLTNTKDENPTGVTNKWPSQFTMSFCVSNCSSVYPMSVLLMALGIMKS